MVILVTGGYGFIGSSFLHRFVPARPEATFVNVDSLTYAANPLSLRGVDARPNYRFVRADIRDEVRMREVFREFAPDWVVHFAAESHVDRSIDAPHDFLTTNVLGTMNLLEAARASWGDSPGRQFLHVSTDEVYGSLGPEGSFTEETRYDPSSPYSASKAASDHLVRAYGRTYGLPFKITNCSNNYGPRQFPEKLIPLMIENARVGRPLPVYGDGMNVRDWLYVDDHADAVMAVADRGRIGETYNVGGDSERANLDVVHLVCRLVAQETGQDESAVLGLATFVPDRPGHDRRYAVDASKIRGELGWRPARTFEAGLRETVRWYLDNDDWCEAIRSGEYRRLVPGGAA